jgi:hypothetical protein
MKGDFMGIINEYLRMARAEAQARAARMKTDDQQAAIDYNIMMGNLEEPIDEDEEMEGEIYG